MVITTFDLCSRRSLISKDLKTLDNCLNWCYIHPKLILSILSPSREIEGWYCRTGTFYQLIPEGREERVRLSFEDAFLDLICLKNGEI